MMRSKRPARKSDIIANMQPELDLSLSAPSPLHGESGLLGDKSLSHRAALFAALAEGESVIDGFLVSGVTRVMLNALTNLGAEWSLDKHRLTVRGKGLAGFASPSDPINCGNSATTIRMLAGAIAATGKAATLDGSDGLRKRPMDRVLIPLANMGARIESVNGCAPLKLTARTAALPLRPIDYDLPVASAQVKSCLILAALAAAGTSEIREPGPSRDHTERMLKAMGADIRENAPRSLRVSPLIRPLSPLRCTLPGDISSAAFPMVAAAIVPGSSILLREVGVNPTRTGLLEVLAAMGAELKIINKRFVAGEPAADILLNAKPLKAVSVGGETVVRMIDEFPAMAIAACFADGVTEVRDAEELRYKETDRISVLCKELRALGVSVEERQDGFRITGGTISGGTCHARGDHRLAMSLALAGLASPAPVVVRDAAILNESFPAFLPTLRSLGVRTNQTGTVFAKQKT
ncbi:MAG: 3-phosphoshikimate 1-carboxyvinyltransferase [Kiritimatiellae bacterium]|nr:3-phosphoshikimate 1-carboxyvinyltransferase [Kiritimatiellia bacterium]